MYLVVGLGNPGKTYQHTRHNVGFMVVDRLAGTHSIKVTRERFSSFWAPGEIAGRKVLLAKPQTFMNRSGQAVAALMAYYKLAVQDLLVIHDDLDVDFGSIKIVRSGGSGGHRGIRSIHEILKENQYVRVKVGIGRPRFNEAVEDYVLSPWYEDQREQVVEMVDYTAEAVTAIIADGLEKAMTVFHADRSP
ncbi:MAG: aminoacyl-tRNA hydrolase [Syntrophobacterales bacterium]